MPMTVQPSRANARARIAGLLAGRTSRPAFLTEAVSSLTSAWGLAAINPDTFGFLGSVRTDADVSISSGSNVLTSPNAPWTAADVGKSIDVQGAGVAGGTLSTTISAFTNAGQVTLSANASTTVSAGVASTAGISAWGTPSPVQVSSSPLTNPDGSVVFEPSDLNLTNFQAAGLIVPGSSSFRTFGERFGQESNVKDFGAIGDGTTDDTAAINAALAAGAKGVFFPVGTYRITGKLTVPSGISIRGVPNFLYPDFAADIGKVTPGYAGKCSIIQSDAGYNGAFFNQLAGVVLDGLTIRKTNYPSPTTADVTDGNASWCIVTRCRFENIAAFKYDGAAAHGDIKFVYNRVCYTQKDFFYGAFVDALIHGNTFTAHNGTAVNFLPGSGLCTLSENRFEYGNLAVYAYQARDVLVIGNHFDRSGTAHIRVFDSDLVIANNDFWRSAYTNSGDDVSHIHIEQPRRVTVIGNKFTSGFQDGGGGIETPQYVATIKDSNKRRVTWRGNDTGSGYTVGVFRCVNTVTEAVDADRVDLAPGLMTPNTATDPIAAIIKTVDDCCVSGVEFVIYESRKVNTFTSMAGRVVLVGAAGTAVNYDQTTGTSNLAGAHNVTIGGLTYTRMDSRQMVSAVPNGFDQQGRFPIATLLWAASPAAASPMGWIKTATGSPDTWRAMPNL